MATFTIKELADYYRALQERLAAERQEKALVIAGDLLALIQLRIQSEGRNAQGARFSPYSPGYAKQRRAKGAQTNYVDFTVTGEMWRNTRPVVISHTLFTTLVEIAPRTESNAVKMGAALTRPKSSPRGNLLTPSDSEVADVSVSNLARVEAIII